jgi:hypothetical protein
LLRANDATGCSQSAYEYPLACHAVDDDVRFVTLAQKALQAFLSAEPRAAIPAINHLLRGAQSDWQATAPARRSGGIWSISAMTPAGVPR